MAKRLINLIVAAFIIFNITAIAAPPGAKIKGVVLDAESSAPIEGVSLYIKGGLYSTDQAGGFTLDNLTPGDYLIHTRSPRHLNKVLPLRLLVGENPLLTIKLKLRITKLEGIVMDEEGHPVIGVEIYANPEIDETKTDEKGYFVFDKKRILDANRKPVGEQLIPEGEYTVYAQKLQYTKAEKNVKVIPGLLNSVGTMVLNKVGVTLPEGEKKDIGAPASVDEPTEGLGEVKLD